MSMKKVFALFTVIMIATTLSTFAADTTLGAFVNKLNQKEQEINNKIVAQQQASAAKRAELEKKQAEQQKAAEAKKEELRKQQEAQKNALEKAKKDAQARQDARKKVVENEVNAWKNLLEQK